MFDTNPPPPRKPGPRDFDLDVEGIGTFTFAHRAMDDQVAIEVERRRILRGQEPSDWLAQLTDWMSTLRVLLVAAPSGFDLAELDPLDDDSFKQLARVYAALREKEHSFRKKPTGAYTGGGQAAGGDGHLLVSPQVPALPAGSPVPAAHAG